MLIITITFCFMYILVHAVCFYDYFFSKVCNCKGSEHILIFVLKFMPPPYRPPDVFKDGNIPLFLLYINMIKTPIVHITINICTTPFFRQENPKIKFGLN